MESNRLLILQVLFTKFVGGCRFARCVYYFAMYAHTYAHIHTYICIYIRRRRRGIDISRVAKGLPEPVSGAARCHFALGNKYAISVSVRYVCYSPART